MAELEINNSKELEEKLLELSKDASINKPTEEEIAKFKEEFDNAEKEWVNTIYKIGTPEEAKEIITYIRHFIENRYIWQKDAWMGIVKLVDELDAAEILFSKTKGLELCYQAVEFTYYMLTNPCGIGVKSAKDFESEIQTYKNIAIMFGKQVESAREKIKDIAFLKEKWGAACQGFYLEVEPTDEELAEKEEDVVEKTTE